MVISRSDSAESFRTVFADMVERSPDPKNILLLSTECRSASVSSASLLRLKYEPDGVIQIAPTVNLSAQVEGSTYDLTTSSEIDCRVSTDESKHLESIESTDQMSSDLSVSVHGAVDIPMHDSIKSEPSSESAGTEPSTESALTALLVRPDVPAANPLAFLDMKGNREVEGLSISTKIEVSSTMLSTSSESSSVCRTSSSLDDEGNQSPKRRKLQVQSPQYSSRSKLNNAGFPPLVEGTTRSPNRMVIPQLTTDAANKKLTVINLRPTETTTAASAPVALSPRNRRPVDSDQRWVIRNLIPGARSITSSLPKSISMVAKDETLKRFVESLGTGGLFEISYNRAIFYEAKLDTVSETISILRVRNATTGSAAVDGGDELKLELVSTNAGTIQSNGVQALRAQDISDDVFQHTQSQLIRPLWSGTNFKSGYSNHILVSFRLQNQLFTAQVRLKSGPDDLYQKRSAHSYPFRLGNATFRLTLTCRRLSDEGNLATTAASSFPNRCAERSQQMPKSKKVEKNDRKHVYGLIAAYSRLDDVECYCYEIRLESSVDISMFRARVLQTKDSTVNIDTEEYCIVCKPTSA